MRLQEADASPGDRPLAAAEDADALPGAASDPGAVPAGNEDRARLPAAAARPPPSDYRGQGTAKANSLLQACNI